ncbi:hypothetical protein, partial [Streptomyces djakartensis]|uniref:hypothetical protein n=1 Tax=Streptomyces djakartensis TaxID=68193 RepID=UPI0034E0064F
LILSMPSDCFVVVEYKKPNSSQVTQTKTELGPDVLNDYVEMHPFCTTSTDYSDGLFSETARKTQSVWFS